jgi:ABC-type antimicrobial peptide transport system permease subunit
MFSYASKRITRGKGLFLALFLSVALASTLFSGIIQGSDAISVSLSTNLFGKVKYDALLVANEYMKNVTKTKIWDAETIFANQEGVAHVDHFVMMPKVWFGDGSKDKQLQGILIAIPDNSELYQGIKEVAKMEYGKLYPDVSCINATSIPTGGLATLTFETYNAYGGLAGFEKRIYNFTMGPTIALDDQTFTLAVNEYNRYLSAVISGRDTVGGRPAINVVLVNEQTMRTMLEGLMSVETRLPVKDPFCIALFRFDRSKIVNSWDIPESQLRAKRVVEQLNGVGAPYYYVPRNYLSDVLTTIYSSSNSLKITTMLVMIPVFFTAWFLGLTISDMSLNRRRREIGLLFTRGMTHRQVLFILLFEAVLVGVFAGLVGVLAGAFILPFVITGLEFNQIIGVLSPANLGTAILFSLLLSVLAVYRPASKAIKLEVVDALSEYRAEDEDLGTWHEPVLALFFGAYKLAILLLQINLESLRPTSGDFISSIIFNTWYGLDYILGFIWSILLFYGITKLFLLYAPWFPKLLGAIASRFVGDASYFTALSSRRNMKRTMAYTFMATLIIAYSFQVIGNSSSTMEFTSRVIESQNGSDFSVVLYNQNESRELSEKISKMPGVSATAVEVEFEVMSSLGRIPIRAINTTEWKNVAYLDLYNLDPVALQLMDEELARLTTEFELSGNPIMEVYPGILDRGVTNPLGMKTDGTGRMNIRVETRTYTLNIIGLFGRSLGDYWIIQDPTVYMPSQFLERVDNKFIVGVRILVKLNQGADTAQLTTNVKALSKNVMRIDIAKEQVNQAINAVTVAGPRRIEELGVVFACLVAALGIFLIVTTQLQSRRRELSLMVIRGFSPKQLIISLLVENLGMTAFAVITGMGIGWLNLIGTREVFNQLVTYTVERQLIFTPTSILSIVGVVALMVVATSVPILITVKRISENPIMESEE